MAVSVTPYQGADDRDRRGRRSHSALGPAIAAPRPAVAPSSLGNCHARTLCLDRKARAGREGGPPHAAEPVGADPREKTFFGCPEHEDELRGYTERITRHGRLFIVLMLASIIAALVFVCARSAVGAAATAIAIGIVIPVLPFATAENVQMTGCVHR